MPEGRWEIGICGTFDVSNYGDLLFPLLAEAELTQRLGPVILHRFSYTSKTPPEWPYEVTSIAALPDVIQRLDAMLIGGGFLVRFDKEVAPGYFPPSPEIHHPTGYWLTPALMALQHNVPVVWNAPGMHCNAIPGWAAPLVSLALTLSRYISVRDEPSRAALVPLTSVAVAAVPDTGFGLARVLNLDGPPSAAYTRIAEKCGLDKPYVVVQATLGMEKFTQFLERHAGQLRHLRFLAVPIGPALGERADIIDSGVPGVVQLPGWPNPLVIAELIGRSQAVVGHSYHLCLTALAYGVPIFTRQNLTVGKYSALQHVDTIFPLPGHAGLEWFLARVGRTSPTAAARGACDLLRGHWDRIAEVVRGGRAQTAPTLNRFWQTLPALLEDAANREEDAGKSSANDRRDAEEALAAALAELAAAREQSFESACKLDNMGRELTRARAETAMREARIADIVASASWRMTGPMRYVLSRLLRNGGRG